MFNIHLPLYLYEQLPRVYLLIAVVVAFLDLSAAKWVAVAALVWASWETWRRRRSYRDAQRRAAIRRRVARRYGLSERPDGDGATVSSPRPGTAEEA